jgi:hypothetical protein
MDAAPLYLVTGPVVPIFFVGSPAQRFQPVHLKFRQYLSGLVSGQSDDLIHVQTDELACQRVQRLRA